MAQVKEPPALRFDLVSQAFKNDAFPTLAAMRAAGRVIRVQFPLLGDVWMATTYELVNTLLRDHDRFVQNPAAAGHRGMTRLMRRLPGNLRPITTNMLLRDPPDHRRLRALVDQAFQKQSVESLRPRLETLAEGALNQLEAQRAAGKAADVDLLTRLARPYPLSVICELLGLPAGDRPRFTRWARQFTTAGNPFALIAGLFFGLGPM